MSLMFADDTKVFKAITSKKDIDAIQRDLIRLEDWSNMWLLKFHPEKCKVLTIGDLDKIERPQAFHYELHSTVLEHVFEEKDLGVYIDHKLKFDVHIEWKIKMANAMLGLIRRTFNCLKK